jgi:hypothetical protein
MNRKAIQIHDVVNLWLIPIVGVLTVLGMSAGNDSPVQGYL